MAKTTLTADIVRAMLIDLDAGMSITGVSAKHGVSRATISHITRGRTWQHVTADFDGADMTEAELDALIAERLPTMPNEPRLPPTDNTPHAVARGRGVQMQAARVPGG